MWILPRSFCRPSPWLHRLSDEMKARGWCADLRRQTAASRIEHHPICHTKFCAKENYRANHGATACHWSAKLKQQACIMPFSRPNSSLGPLYVEAPNASHHPPAGPSRISTFQTSRVVIGFSYLRTCGFTTGQVSWSLRQLAMSRVRRP